MPSSSGHALIFECGVKPAQCTLQPDGKTNLCDLAVYVVWTGTDANGHYFKSAGRRFSRFRQFGLGNVVDTLTDAYKWAEEQAKEGVDAVSG